MTESAIKSNVGTYPVEHGNRVQTHAAGSPEPYRKTWDEPQVGEARRQMAMAHSRREAVRTADDFRRVQGDPVQEIAGIIQATEEEWALLLANDEYL